MGRYVTLAELGRALKTPSDPTATDWNKGEYDEDLNLAIDSAEGEIDLYCGAQFDALDAAATDREYWTSNPGNLLTDAISDPTGVAVSIDGTAVASTCWRWVTKPTPTRAGKHLLGVGWYEFPCDQPVTVTATYGWPQIPPEVREAARLRAARLYMRQDAPLGMVDSEAAGGMYLVPSFDADIMRLLKDYRPRYFTAGGVWSGGQS